MKRKLSDWVGAFEEMTTYTGSPSRLRRWAGIACVAGALERKVWVRTKGSPFYPNLYAILTAPPGVGKSAILDHVRSLWAGLDGHYLSAPNVSKASLVDELNDAQRTLIHPGKNPPTVEFNSLKILVSELGVFLPDYANDFMNTLTDLYDCFPYKERKRTKNLTIEMPKPQLNLLTATTPSYLTALLPEGAWDQGFLSRTILIYGGEHVPISLFAYADADPIRMAGLRSDLEIIANLYGEMKFTPEAAEFIDSWYLSGQAPIPSSFKLQHYNTRRTGHLLKLSMVACVSNTNELVITVEHIQQAMDWLFDAEIAMEEIFKAMNNGGDGKVMDECWHMLFQYKARYNKGAPRALLIEFISRRVPSYNVERLIDLMEKADMVRAVTEKGSGLVYYAKERKPM